MNQENQPEALRLADWCEANSSGAYRPSSQAASELRRQYFALNEWFEKTQWAQKTVKPRELGMHRADILRARIESLQAELVAEAARTAEEKLRADQMTEQHRMQCNMRAALEEEIECLTELAKIGAEDRGIVSELYSQLSAIGAGGVESLRKNGAARGQSGFEAWWRDKYPSFSMHAPDAWEAAMHHAAQPAQEHAAAAQAAPTHTEAPIDEPVTKQMIDAGAKAAREYMARTGGNNLTVIYRAMRAVAPAGGVSASPAQEHASPLSSQGREPEAWLASYQDREGNDGRYVTTHYHLAVENDARGQPAALYRGASAAAHKDEQA